MIVTVNGNTYEVGPKVFHNMLQLAKSKFKELNVNAIYCVEKLGIAEMRNDTFETKALLNQAVVEYRNKGFKVYTALEVK